MHARGLRRSSPPWPRRCFPSRRIPLPPTAPELRRGRWRGRQRGQLWDGKLSGRIVPVPLLVLLPVVHAPLGGGAELLLQLDRSRPRGRFSLTPSPRGGASMPAVGRPCLWCPLLGSPRRAGRHPGRRLPLLAGGGHPRRGYHHHRRPTVCMSLLPVPRPLCSVCTCGGGGGPPASTRQAPVVYEGRVAPVATGWPAGVGGGRRSTPDRRPGRC